MEENTVLIGGKEFKIARITLANNSKMMKTISRKDMQFFNRKDWNGLCRVALEMNFLWKYFHVIPKELKWTKVLLSEAGGLQVDFFSRCKAELEEEMKRLESLGLLKPNTKP
jgi:hypothetical protein